VAGIYECRNEHGVPSSVGNFLTSCKPASLSSRTLLHGVSKLVISTLRSSLAFDVCFVGSGLCNGPIALAEWSYRYVCVCV
jgi:hypothetical protein